MVKRASEEDYYKCLKDHDFFQDTYFIVYLIILMLN